MAFSDRFEAGSQLATKLSQYKGKPNLIVLAIPRGGVETGYALARELRCPLDIVISKKIPYPGQPELAIGAVCNDLVSLDNEFVSMHNIGTKYVDEEIKKLKSSIRDRYFKLTAKHNYPQIKDRLAIITDDGIATGHTFLAAVDFVKSKKPKKVIAAIPVGPPENIEIIKKKVDELVVIDTPAFFMAVGEFYRDFAQTSDEDVLKYIKMANK